jgi:hypothetical protein
MAILDGLGPGGNYNLEIKVPDELKNGIELVVPDHFASDLHSVAASLHELAALKGVIWA